jgi:hypothetical protein
MHAWLTFLAVLGILDEAEILSKRCHLDLMQVCGGPCLVHVEFTEILS